MIRLLLNATIVALIFFATLFPVNYNGQITMANSETNTFQFTEKRNPGFVIWEDPNTPSYYAYATSMLTGSLERRHFWKGDYDKGQAFVRIGHEKPRANPETGETFNPANLRLVEVRPYGHDAFYPSNVDIDQNDTRVVINIDGIDFTRTPYKEINNPKNKGTWGYHGDRIYSENHHIPLELVWEYRDTSSPSPVGCPAGGVQTSVTEESGRLYYSCNCDEDGCDVCVEIYYETTQLYVSEPEPAVVKAGQGTYLEVFTTYTNDNPAHYGRPYAAEKVEVNGIISEEWPILRRGMVELLPDDDEPGLNWSAVTWKLPYAMISEDGTWRMTDSREEAENFVNSGMYNYGGLQRWYVGFDVPDGEEFEFTFETDSHGFNNITLCDKRKITVNGSPYDDFIIRTVDPNNPFPTGEVGINWQGKEEIITSLKDWYNEPHERFKATSAEIEHDREHGNVFFRYMKENIWGGLSKLLGG